MKVYKIFAVVAMMVIGMTVSSCDKWDNPVRHADTISIGGDKNEKGQIEMMVGAERQLVIILDHYWTPTKDKFTWQSSDSSVATVDENGLLKAVTKGTALITAQWTEDQSRQATVEVVVKDDGQSGTIDVADDEVSQDEAESPRFVFGK